MFSEKYTVKIMIDDQTLFVRDYTTYQAILDDFPVFETTENVRTCQRMLEKNLKTKIQKITKISTHPGKAKNSTRFRKRARIDLDLVSTISKVIFFP